MKPGYLMWSYTERAYEYMLQTWDVRHGKGSRFTWKGTALHRAFIKGEDPAAFTPGHPDCEEL